MCGIVGYVGDRPGARRRRRRACAGWSTAATTRPASPCVADGALRHRASGPASSATWTRRSRPSTAAASPARPASGTPAGPPTAPRPTATPTRTWTRRPGRGHPQRHHRELRRAARRARGATASSSRSDTDTEVVAHLLAADAARRHGRRPGRRRCGAVCRRLDGRVHAGRGRTPTTPDVVVGARRNSPLVRRRRRRRELPRQRRRRVHRAHPRRGRARPGPGRRDHARTGTRSPTSTATPVDGQAVPRRLGRSRPPRRAATTTSCSRRSPSSRARSPTRCCGRLDGDGGIVLDEMRLTDAGPARRRQGLRRRVRHGVPRRADRQVRDRALDPDPGRGRAGPRVPLPRPGARPADAGRRDHASPARRWTR